MDKSVVSKMSEVESCAVDVPVRVHINDEPYWLARVAEAQKKYGPAHAETFYMQYRLVNVMFTQRQTNVSVEELAQEVVAGLRATVGVEHKYTVAALTLLGAVLAVAGKLGEAITALTEAEAGTSRLWGSFHAATLTVRFRRAVLVHQFIGDNLAGLRAIVADCRREIGVDNATTVWAIETLATELLWCGLFDEADVLAREAITIRRQSLLPSMSGAIDQPTAILAAIVKKKIESTGSESESG